MLFNGNRSLPVALLSLCSLAASLPSVGWSQDLSVSAKEAMGPKLSFVFKKELKIRAGISRQHGDPELVKQATLHFAKGSDRCELRTHPYMPPNVSEGSLQQVTGELLRVVPGREVSTTIAQRYTDVLSSDPEGGESARRVTFLFGSGGRVNVEGDLSGESTDPTFYIMVCWVKRPTEKWPLTRPVTLAEVQSILGDAIEVKYSAPELREARILPAPGQSVSPASAVAL